MWSMPCWDARHSGPGDDLTASVSYEEVCEIIQQEMKAQVWKLVEAVAEHISAVLFAKYPALQELSLEIAKPDAPIDADFQSVSVCIHRKRHTVYLAYGSNEGECINQIQEGIAAIDHDPFCRVKHMTKPIKSTPYGGVEQKDFYNGVIRMETIYEPLELMRFLQSVEKAQGRDRSKQAIHWGPRTLDLDILLYDDLVYDSKELTIPHPEMGKRDFVILPLAEIARAARLRGLNVWSFSGYTFEQLTNKRDPQYADRMQLLELVDVLVDGKFVREKRDISLRFRGSSNQRIIDVRRSLALGAPCTIEEYMKKAM